jgi:hypothetical protein
MVLPLWRLHKEDREVEKLCVNDKYMEKGIWEVFARHFFKKFA